VQALSLIEGSLQLVKVGGWLYCGKIGQAHILAGAMLEATQETFGWLNPNFEERPQFYKNDTKKEYADAVATSRVDYLIIHKE
jgi:hypothetical protein